MQHSLAAIGLSLLLAGSVYIVHAQGSDRETRNTSGNSTGDNDVYSGLGSATAIAAPAPATTEAMLNDVIAARDANRARVNEAQAVSRQPGVSRPNESGQRGTVTSGADDAAAAMGLSGPIGDAFENTVVEPQAEGTTLDPEDVSYDVSNGTVEIHVNEANLVEVLRMLSMQSQKNIIASRAVSGTVTANLYGVTVREALDAILKSNGYTYREEGNFVYVYTAEEMVQMQQAMRVRTTEIFRLHYINAVSAVNMIKPVMSDTGEVAFSEPAAAGLGGGGGGNTHADLDVLVVTDFEENLTQIRRVLTELDRRPQQVLIEATILRATLKEENSLGIDFQILGGVDFGTLGAAGGSVGGSTGVVNGGVLDADGAGALAEEGIFGMSTGFKSRVPAGGLEIGVIQNNIAVFLRALESVTDTVIVANPKILALNKQQGEVFVGNDIGYRTTVTNENGTTSETVEFLKTGTRLVFRPYIGDDGFIRLEVRPEDSSGNLQNNLPFKFTTEVKSNIMVRDGHTVIIGGLFREDSNTGRSQVPFLGNIPVAGNLFRSQNDATVREEVIVLLTPHIIKDDAVLARLSADEMSKIEQLRVGIRRGMLPWGRERLAEGAYESAMRELAKPKPDTASALWHLNVATNLNPRFIEAIALREQLTGERNSVVDNALTRSFVTRMIMQDLAPTPPATQPAGINAPTDVPAPTQPRPTPELPRAALPVSVEPRQPVGLVRRFSSWSGIEVGIPQYNRVDVTGLGKD